MIATVTAEMAVGRTGCGVGAGFEGGRFGGALYGFGVGSSIGSSMWLGGEGGQLSHGAIVAREYGIPSVMDVTDATRRLRTGQRVRLDGDRGVVELL